MLNTLPLPYRILALMLLLLSTLGAGLVVGLEIESNRRDALDLEKLRQSDANFKWALGNGKKHAAQVIEWQAKAKTYYYQWQRELNHAEDSQLASCVNTENSPAAVFLSDLWVGMYNNAWEPKLTTGSDTSRAANTTIEASTVSPREVLDNVRINADLCGEDRQRYQSLINYINESINHATYQR